MLPAAAQCVGATAAQPYRAEQTQRLSHCAVGLVLSFSIAVDSCPQASFCCVLMVFIHPCPFLLLRSVRWLFTAVSNGCQPAANN